MSMLDANDSGLDSIIGPYTVNVSEKNVKFRGTWIALYCSLGIVCGACSPRSRQSICLIPIERFLTLTATSARNPSVCSLLLRYILHRENAKRADIPIEPLRPFGHGSETTSVNDEKEGTSSPGPEEEDRTDWQNKSFRYTL